MAGSSRHLCPLLKITLGLMKCPAPFVFHQEVPKATYWQMPMAELAAGIASRKILSPSFWKKIKHLDLGEYK